VGRLNRVRQSSVSFAFPFPLNPCGQVGSGAIEAQHQTVIGARINTSSGCWPLRRCLQLLP